MTLSSSLNRNNYVGDGAQGAFAYQFRVDDEAHLQVYLDAVLQGSGYVVSNVGNDNGGNVTFSTAPASGAVVTLLRALPLTQPTDIPTQGPLNSAALEQQLDQTVMQVQQLDEKIGRSVVLPVSSDVSGLALPTPAAGNLLGWDSGATNLQNYAQGGLPAIVPSAFMATVLDDGDAATVQATLRLKDGSAALNVKDVALSAVDSVLAENASYNLVAYSDYAGDVVNAAFFDKPCYDPKIVNAVLSWFPTDANLTVIASQNGSDIDVVFIDRRSGAAVKTITSADWSWLAGATVAGIKFKYGVVAVWTSDAGFGLLDLRNGKLVYRDFGATVLRTLNISDIDIGPGGPANIVDGNGIRPCVGGSYGDTSRAFLMHDDWHTAHHRDGSVTGLNGAAIIAGRFYYRFAETTNELRSIKSYSFLLDITADDWAEDNGAANSGGAVLGKGVETFIASNGVNTYLSGSAEGIDKFYVSPRNKLDYTLGFTMDSTRMYSICGDLRSAHFVDSITADRGTSAVTLTHVGGGLSIASANGSGTRQKVSGFDASNYAEAVVNLANGTSAFGFSVDFCSEGTLNNTHNVLLNWHHATNNSPRLYMSLHTSGITIGAGDNGGSTTVAGPTFGPTVAELNDDPTGWHNVSMLIVPALGVFGSFDGGPWKLAGNPLFLNTMNPGSGTNTIRIGESISNPSYGFNGSFPFGGSIGEVSRFLGVRMITSDAIQWWAHNRIASYEDVSTVMPASETPVWGASDRSVVGNGIRDIVGGATKVFKIGDGMAVTNIDQTALDGAVGINASTVGGYIARGEYGLLSAIGEVYQNAARKDVGRGLVGVGHNGGPRWLDGVGTVGIDAYLLASKSNVTGDSTNYTVPFDTVVLQNGLILNTATGQMIALVSGWYLVHGNLDIEGWDASTTRVAAWVYHNTTNLLFAVHDLTWNFAGSERIIGGSADRRRLNAGDYIELKAYATGGAKIADVTSGGAGINRQTTLSAHLVG